jgi:hypothetical protein
MFFGGIARTPRRCRATVPVIGAGAAGTAAPTQPEGPEAMSEVASRGVIQGRCRQGMVGDAGAFSDGTDAVPDVGTTDGPEATGARTPMMHGDDNHIVPVAEAMLLPATPPDEGDVGIHETSLAGTRTTHAAVVTPDFPAAIRC